MNWCSVTVALNIWYKDCKYGDIMFSVGLKISRLKTDHLLSIGEDSNI